MKVFTESEKTECKWTSTLKAAPLCLMSTTSEDRFLLMSVMADPFLPMRGEQ